MAKIALDAGHGLYTSGKQTPDGIKEWTLNDKVRDKVALILKDYDVTIINTDNDEGNTDETLSYRVNKYLNAGVDVFVSIHHNALSGNWNNATGVEVFVDNNCTAADLKLANAIYTRMVKYTGLKGRGVKKLNFVVINQNKIPAVLCEGGFMDGTYDYKFITSEIGIQAYARAVAEGLIEFLSLKKKETVKMEPTTTSKTLYRVQTGSFRKKEYADGLYHKVKDAGFDAYIVQINGLYKIQVGAYSVKANATKMAKKLEAAGFSTFVTTTTGDHVSANALKSIDEIAKEVIRGKWGSGTDRKNRLIKAGYDYAAVQEKVNELM